MLISIASFLFFFLLHFALWPPHPLLFCLNLLSLHQVILATIERHKQNSETFNKAFNSSFSREDDHVPESPVSLTLPPSVSSLSVN